MNLLITSIGKREQYRLDLVQELKSFNVSISGERTIEQLEKLVLQQRNKK